MDQSIIHRFSAEKDTLLKKQRGIGFDDIISAMENGDLLDSFDHFSAKYPHQKLYIVRIGNYAYMVPYVKTKNEIFLKTFYPSRDMTKRYLKKEQP